MNDNQITAEEALAIADAIVGTAIVSACAQGKQLRWPALARHLVAALVLFECAPTKPSLVSVLEDLRDKGVIP